MPTRSAAFTTRASRIARRRWRRRCARPTSAAPGSRDARRAIPCWSPSAAARSSAGQASTRSIRPLSVLVVAADPRHRETQALLTAAFEHEVEIVIGAVQHLGTARVTGIRMEYLAALVLGEDADSHLIRGTDPPIPIVVIRPAV